MSPAPASGPAGDAGSAFRVGFGLDVHRLAPGSGPIRLCGVSVPAPFELIGTSDGDPALHAVIDALLGAAALGDIGRMFPSDDASFEGADSRDLLAAAREALVEAGYRAASVDVTVVSESVRVAAHRETMREVLAGLLGLDVNAVSVKATSTDGLGFLGSDDGLAAVAVASIAPVGPQR